MGRIVALVNQKGGVGKTTVTLGLASAAQAAGNRVLVVDLDPQASSSWVLGVEPAELEDSTAELLASAANPIVYESGWGDGVDLLPASQRLQAHEAGSGRSPERRLRAAIETLAGQLTRVLRPAIDTYQVHGRQLTLCREVAALCAQLGDSPREVRARNLLYAFLPTGFTDITPARLLVRFGELWERFGLPGADAPVP